MVRAHEEAEIAVSEAAARRLRDMVAQQGGRIRGVRLGIKAAGCSGLEYVMDYAEGPNADDLVKACDGFLIIVDPSSYSKALRGLTVDFQEDALSSTFVFINPNKKGECGCGASFSV